MMKIPENKSSSAILIISLGKTPKSGIRGSVPLQTFVTCCQSIFQKGCIQLQFHQWQHMKMPISLHLILTSIHTDLQ